MQIAKYIEKKVRLRRNLLDDKAISNPKLYYILGAIEGDGTIKNSGFRLSVKDYDFAKFFYDTCIEVLSFKPKFHYYSCDNRYKVDIFSIDFKEKYYLFKPKTKIQKIWYLKGLFDSEGCFCITSDNHKLLSITSGDVPLLMCLQNYLLELGIESKYFPGKKKRNFLRIYSWKIQEKFMDLIGFRIGRKMLLWELALLKRRERDQWKAHGTPIEIMESIKRNYNTGFFTTYEMAKVYGTDRCQIRKILKKFNITPRYNPKYKRPIVSKFIIDKILFYYKQTKFNYTEIGNFVGLNRVCVGRILKNCGVV